MFHREQSDFLPFLRPLLTLQAALCLCCVAIVSPAGTASAQPAGEEQGFEVSSIEFRGNAVLSTSDLKAQLATKESPGFLSKFFHYHISERLGSKIEYFNPAVFGEDVKRLMSYYAARGFSASEIDTSLNFSLQDSSISILLTIREGYWAILDSLGYGGIAGLPEHLAGDIRSGEKIARGDHFNAPLLQEEIQRVLGVLHDNGYPNARYQRDSSWARRYASTGNYAVELSFSPGKWCMFGPVAVEQEVDTLQGGQVRPDITDDIIFTQLDYKPGDMYSQAALFHSERNLNRLGIFDLRGIRTKVPSDADSSNAVPSVITIRPKDKYELAPAEHCGQYLSKGSGVIVDGRLQHRRWETEDGQKRSKHEVVAQTVTFLPKRPDAGGESTPPAHDDGGYEYEEQS